MSKENEICGNCKYYFIQGTCRRYPPQIHLYPTDNQHPILYDVYSGQPYTTVDSWCGEWEHE